MPQYDVVIVGTGCAGSACGALLAAKGLNVALVDRAAFPRPSFGLGWVGARVEPLLAEAGVDGKSILNCPIKDVTLFNGDLSKTAQPKIKSAPGYVIDLASFEGAIVEAAGGAGAELHHECTVTDIALRENEVQLDTDHTDPLVGRIVVLASGRQTSLAPQLGLDKLPATGPGAWTAYLSAKLPKPVAANRGAVALVFGLTREGGHGLLVMAGDQATVTVHVHGPREEALVWLGRTCQGLAEQGLILAGLEAQLDRAVVTPPPPSALEMETHVGKHALVIGDAGGFVSTVSAEGLVPGMWSGKIAAEVIEAALAAPTSQDALMTFDTRWRLEMAEYLRMPNTDMEFLIPLIFSNPPMADRVTKAFFLGENI